MFYLLTSKCNLLQVTITTLYQIWIYAQLYLPDLNSVSWNFHNFIEIASAYLDLTVVYGLYIPIFGIYLYTYNSLQVELSHSYLHYTSVTSSIQLFHSLMVLKILTLCVAVCYLDYTCMLSSSHKKAYHWCVAVSVSTPSTSISISFINLASASVIWNFICVSLCM